MDGRDTTPAIPATTLARDNRIYTAIKFHHGQCDWDETEEFFQLTTAALVAAANWARQVGITFEWGPGDPKMDCLPEEHDSPARCYAYRNGKLLGCSYGWRIGIAEPSRERDWAEAETARALIANSFGETVGDEHFWDASSLLRQHTDDAEGDGPP